MLVITVHIFAEYFGVGVTSVAMDGVAPDLNPEWVHRRTNTPPKKVRHATEPAFKVLKHSVHPAIHLGKYIEMA